MLGLGSPLASASHGAETGLGLSTAQPASDAVGEQSTSHSVNEPAIAARPSVVEEAAFDIDEEGNMVFREEWDQPPPVEQSDIDVLMADNWNGFELNLDAEQAQAREVVSLLRSEGSTLLMKTAEPSTSFGRPRLRWR